MRFTQRKFTDAETGKIAKDERDYSLPHSHNTLYFPLKFCNNYCFQFLLGTCMFPSEIENNSLCIILGGNKLYYGNVKVDNGWIGL